VGDHDENISIEKAKEIAGAEIVDKLDTTPSKYLRSVPSLH
jgi:hypothetical protein